MYSYQVFKYADMWYWIKGSLKHLKDERVDLWHGPFVIEAEAKADAEDHMKALSELHLAGCR